MKWALRYHESKIALFPAVLCGPSYVWDYFACKYDRVNTSLNITDFDKKANYSGFQTNANCKFQNCKLWNCFVLVRETTFARFKNIHLRYQTLLLK